MNHPSQQSKIKSWWSPVWRGLVVDARGQHYRKMKSALWLFTYLLMHADRKTGQLRRKHATISQDMGVNARTIRRWLERLSRHGYVRVTHTGRALVIHIQKWRSLNTASRPASSDPKSG